MDNDKSIVERITETVKEIAHIAADAADQALKPQESPVKAADQRAAAYIPLAGDGLVSDPMMVASIVMARARKKKRAAPKRAAKAAKKAGAKKAVKKKAARKSASKAPKRPAKKSKKAAARNKKKTFKERDQNGKEGADENAQGQPQDLKPRSSESRRRQAATTGGNEPRWCTSFSRSLAIERL
jgi:hypothetical protein